MKITRVQLHHVAVPRLYPTQIAQEGGGAKRLVTHSQFLFVEATTDDGRTGWGELSDIEPDDFPKLDQFQSQVEKLLIGRDPYDLFALHQSFEKRLGYPETSSLPRTAETALDMLCLDLQGQAAGVPIYKLLGGAWRDRVRISWVAYIRENLDQLREEIHAKVMGGFTAFKLKVGVDIDLDDERLAVLRKEAGPKASLKIDPNGGWDLDTARKNVRRLAKYRLDGVETPVGGRRAEDLAVVRKETGVPILEHVNTPQQALDYIKHESVDCFNIATVACGGIGPARVVAQMAETAGLGLLLGSTVEMGPGTLAQLHLAASIRRLTLPSDLIGPGMYQGDVLMQRIYYTQGHLLIPQAPGLGADIDRAQLAALKPK